jgi:hypothetical protein
LVAAWKELIIDNRAVLIGPVRQEVLSGVRRAQAFEQLRDRLRGVDDEPLSVEDYEEAARLYNCCRAAGVTGSTVDLLLCAVASRRGIPLFTTDVDFTRYARHAPLRLYTPASASPKR